MDDADLVKIGKPMELSVVYDKEVYRISGKYIKERKLTRFKYELPQLPAVIETPAGPVQIMLKITKNL